MIEREFVVLEKVKCERCCGEGGFAGHPNEVCACQGMGYSLQQIPLLEVLRRITTPSPGYGPEIRSLPLAGAEIDLKR